jgi:hypothetical protein
VGSNLNLQHMLELRVEDLRSDPTLAALGAGEGLGRGARYGFKDHDGRAVDYRGSRQACVPIFHDGSGSVFGFPLTRNFARHFR